MKKERRYLIKYHPIATHPVKGQFVVTKRTYLGSVSVTRRIGEKAAMAKAEKLYAEHRLPIKAISATYEEYETRTFQQHRRLGASPKKNLNSPSPNI